MVGDENISEAIDIIIENQSHTDTKEFLSQQPVLARSKSEIVAEIAEVSREKGMTYLYHVINLIISLSARDALMYSSGNVENAVEAIINNTFGDDKSDPLIPPDHNSIESLPLTPPAQVLQSPQQSFRMPDDCYCPLSLEVMNDPVMAADGHTYERTEIELWFTRHNTSPLTNELLISKDLKSNISLRNTISALKLAGFK